MVKRRFTLAGLFTLALLASACKDPEISRRVSSLAPDRGPYEDGPYHRAGFPCTWCHTQGGTATPSFDIAGTVYNGALSGDALEGAQILMFDGAGRQMTLTSNKAGNFFLDEGELTLSFPIWVKLEYQGKTTAMQSPIFREPSCATCHLDPTSPSTMGHVYLWNDR